MVDKRLEIKKSPEEPIQPDVVLSPQRQLANSSWTYLQHTTNKPLCQDKFKKSPEAPHTA